MEKATIQQWRRLNRRWWMADQMARKAQGEVRIAYEEFLLGGLGPTRTQLRKMDERQRRADRWRLRIDILVIRLAGVGAVSGSTSSLKRDVIVGQDIV